jgi:phosphatidylglycerophosphatase A
VNGTLNDRLLVAVATCFGLGYSPIFPGTAGALLGIAIYAPIGLFVSHEPWQSLLIGGALLISCAVTVALGPWAEKRFERKDASCFVTDEVAGFLLTVLLFRTSMYGAPNTWLTILWAFPVTRVIDIVKIPPARQLEKIPSGWGVLADDLLGSVYAAALLHGLAFLIPAAFGM